MNHVIRPLRDRFWPKVDRREKSECWLWQGHVDKNTGYGRIVENGEKRPRKLQAHRVSLLVHGIKLEENLVVDHICRTRACVNPDHLRQVTLGVNTLENSASIQAANKKKTHCPRQHPYDLKSGGRRYCRRCLREKNKKWRANLKHAQAFSNL